ncbi:hypothetical protein GCM10027038_34120 [Arthrobacter bambusae]
MSIPPTMSFTVGIEAVSAAALPLEELVLLAVLVPQAARLRAITPAAPTA